MLLDRDYPVHAVVGDGVYYHLDFSRISGKPPFDTLAFDTEGIPRFNYRSGLNAVLGPQYNIVFICWWALSALHRHLDGEGDASALADFHRQVDWLARTAQEVPGGDVVWPSTYPYAEGFTHVSPPWIAGMGHGLAASVLVRAWRLTGDRRFLALAERGAGVMRKPMEQGGVRRMLEGYVHYELRGAAVPSRILDCHAFATLGLYDLSREGVAWAAEGFQDGVRTLKERLPYWDFHGCWSRMGVLRQPCSPFYHKLNVCLMEVLGRLTGETVFLEAARRWQPAGKPLWERFWLFHLEGLAHVCYRLRRSWVGGAA